MIDGPTLGQIDGPTLDQIDMDRIGLRGSGFDTKLN